MSRSVVRRISRTISGGSITIPSGPRWVKFWHVRVDTEGGAGTDDLEKIIGGKTDDTVVLWLEDSSHDVTVKDNANPGSDKIELRSGAGDMLLDQIKDKLTLVKRKTSPNHIWDERARSPN